MENVENAKFREQEQFLENTKMVFYVISKTVLKNSFQNKEPKQALYIQTLLVFFFFLVDNVQTSMVCLVSMHHY